MLKFVIRRIAYSIPVLIIASALVFFFVHETTNPLARYSQTHDLTLRAREGLRMGLLEQPCRQFVAGNPPVPAETCKTAPLPKQYWFWLSHFLNGQMGQSFTSNRAVSKEIRSALGNTIQLIIWAILLAAVVCALWLHIPNAVRQRESVAGSHAD